MFDSLPMPLTADKRGKKKTPMTTDKERAAKIARLTNSKDPFSSYVAEKPEEDEDEIDEDSK